MKVRKALISDARAIGELIEIFAGKGVMLPRPLGDICSSIRSFFVYEKEGDIKGVAALHICFEELGEVKSLAVSEGFERQGIGKALVTAALEDARALGLRRVFALTYAPDFFKSLGFNDLDKDELPHKIWTECVNCMKFPNCDENAVIIDL